MLADDEYINVISLRDSALVLTVSIIELMSILPFVNVTVVNVIEGVYVVGVCLISETVLIETMDEAVANSLFDVTTVDVPIIIAV